MIFAYLEPTEAAAFRWVGRVVAEIGLQYLTPTVYLALKEESYDRLLAIAGHPVASRYVVKLDYETNGLDFILRQDFDWKYRSMPVISRHDSERPDSLASPRAWRVYQRESFRNMMLPSEKQTTQLLNRAWSTYEAYRTSHKNVQQANFFPEKIMEALKRFRNLKSISADPDGAHKRYVAEIRELLPTLYVLGTRYSTNFDPTTSILLAAESAGLQFETLACQPVSWQIFAQNTNDLAALNRSILHLKIMDIAFSSSQDDFPNEDDTVQEVDFVGKFLDERRVRDLITSATHLEYLGLAFKEVLRSNVHPTLKKTLGNFHWSSLKAVALESLASNEHDLVNFCKRHSRTLKDLSLKDMIQYEGLWHVTFHEVRRAFLLGQQLDTCELRGIFSSPAYRIFMDHPEKRAGITISNYIRATNIGDISLDEYYHELNQRL